MLELDQLTKSYGGRTVLAQLSHVFKAGEFVAIMGQSGSGKSTLMNILGCLDRATSGDYFFNGKNINELGTDDLAQLRREAFGFVFQSYNLLAGATASENVEMPATYSGLSPELRHARATELLSSLGLQERLHHRPNQLSGGQQQRVALARALAPEPQLLLLDEPFSNLDGELRRRLSHEVRDILKARGTSAILVTHDQEEAFAVSDHVGVFKEGKLEQWDTPFNLYHEPLTPFVASFIGQGYFIRGQLLSPDSVQTELGLIRGNRAYTWPIGSAVDVLLRPDDIVYDPDSPQKALIVGKTFLGAATLYRLQLPTGSQLESIFPSHADHLPGQQVGIRVAADHLVVFPAPGSIAAQVNLGESGVRRYSSDS